MTTRSSLKSTYAAEDRRCPWDMSDVGRIRTKIRELSPDQSILYKCFNDVEAELIREQLTPEEQSRVMFSWIFTIPQEEAA